VHFRGSLTDGSEFDSSYVNGVPSTLPVSKLVTGWSEALQMMREGAHWELVIPPSLAYGHHGNGDKVPPNAVLLMDVELIEVLDSSAMGW
jgi:FKBP-type peptidyl-prolyl cis-trans isomerase FklB